MKNYKIAFDGPVASGKSTIAKEVARRLSYIYVDTGAMYRAVTWKALQNNVDFTREEDITAIAKKHPVHFSPDQESERGYRIYVDNDEVTAFLFSEEVNRYVSPVAVVSEVRKILVARQKEIARAGGVVMAGRDITTVVMPDADIKLYLTASEDERAERRLRELIQKGEKAEIAAVIENVRLRDGIDSTREDSPLTIADDAQVLDSTGLSIDQVVDRVLEIVHEKEAVTIAFHEKRDVH